MSSLQSPDEAAEEEENYGADGGDADGAEIKYTRCYVSPAKESRAQPATDEGADDPEDNRDDATRGVPPWHQKLRQAPGDEAEENPIEPERQTLFLPEAGALRYAWCAAASRRHPVDPEEDERADDCENNALD
jgi:hypothetical protein